MLAPILEAINARLGAIPGAETKIGAKSLKGGGKPPRFVWVPALATSGGTKQGQNPRALDVLNWPCDLHVWGVDLGHAERLVAAAVTATRAVVNGRNYRLDAVGPLPEESSNERQGYVLIARITFFVPIIEQDLALLANLTKPTVTVESVSFDNTDSADDDGVLDVGDGS